MLAEKWDIFDSDGNFTGKTTVRGKCTFKSGEYHLVVHIWIISTDGRFLIQRRSDSKKLMPGEWAATGGAAISGEDSFAAANRELFEELSISTDRTTLIPLTRIKRRNSLLDIWVTTCDANSDDLVLQKSEVSKIKWVDRSELENMIRSGRFHNYGKEYFNSVFSRIEAYRKAII